MSDPGIRLLIRATLRADSEPTPEQLEQVMELFGRQWERQGRERVERLATPRRNRE